MSKGYLCFVLHAHLPFVRHPEYETFLEENWLFEAISETYLPLLRVFNRLKEDQVPFQLTISISPTLGAMLCDELLQERYRNHLKKLLELADKELERTKDMEDYYPLAQMYKELYQQNWDDFNELYRGNILKGFRLLEKEGCLNIITTAATHAFLPHFQSHPVAVEAQVQTGIIAHSRIFGKQPKGMWLPECGYYPGLEKFLKNSEVEYFFTSAHSLLLSDSKPEYGVYAPVRCPNGVAVFGRDIPSSQAVWSDEEGYPADRSYRDFYRDIGFDLPLDYIGDYVHDDGIRINTGFKYYAVTGKTDDKKPYNPAEALAKIDEHADNFLYNRLKHIKKLGGFMDRPPMITTPFDAELFGHWWFEGPQWIEAVLRKAAKMGDDIMLTTPDQYLKEFPSNQKMVPAFGSWGNKGYGEVWLDGSNDWVYRHVHMIIERMQELVERYPDESGLKERVLNQAAREVLLAQASDWPFIIKTGTTVPYAEKRIKEHIANFNRIYDNLCRGNVNTEWLTNLEKKNNCFPGVDYRIFGED